MNTLALLSKVARYELEEARLQALRVSQRIDAAHSSLMVLKENIQQIQQGIQQSLNTGAQDFTRSQLFVEQGMAEFKKKLQLHRQLVEQILSMKQQKAQYDEHAQRAFMRMKRLESLTLSRASVQQAERASQEYATNDDNWLIHHHRRSNT